MVIISCTQLRVSQKLERLKAPSDSLDSPSMVENKHLVRKILHFPGYIYGQIATILQNETHQSWFTF